MYTTKRKRKRILYGVAGEGFGHSSRSKEIITHITKRHKVKVVSYDRGYNILSHFDTTEINGLSIHSIDHAVSFTKTVWENLLKGRKLYNDWIKINRICDYFQPDLIITDFEPLTAHLANFRNIPLITLDNQHRIRYTDIKCGRRLRHGLNITKQIISCMIPCPNISIVTTLQQEAPLKHNVIQFNPIIRQEILDLNPTEQDYILVYLTQNSNSIIESLKRFNEKFIVYGYDKTEYNIIGKPYGTSFIKDLENCKAIISSAGFTLISEAMFLGKPICAIPIKGQFEQELNAYQVESMGHGTRNFNVFLDNLDLFKQEYVHDNNVGVFNYLDNLLDIRLTRSEGRV